MPEEIVLQLTHKDVVLDFYKSRKKQVLAMVGGDALRYREGFLFFPESNQAIAKLSTRMLESLREWESKGYSVYDAFVRFVVAWRPKDADASESTTGVLLPELHLKRT